MSPSKLGIESLTILPFIPLVISGFDPGKSASRNGNLYMFFLEIGTSSNVILPETGFFNEQIQFNKVDFPDPFKPTSPCKSPSSNFNESPFNTICFP